PTRHVAAFFRKPGHFDLPTARGAHGRGGEPPGLGNRRTACALVLVSEGLPTRLLLVGRRGDAGYRQVLTGLRRGETNACLRIGLPRTHASLPAVRVPLRSGAVPRPQRRGGLLDI